MCPPPAPGGEGGWGVNILEDASHRIDLLQSNLSTPIQYFLYTRRWFLNFQAAMGKRKINIKFQLVSVKTVTKSADSSEAASEFLFRARNYRPCFHENQPKTLGLY